MLNKEYHKQWYYNNKEKRKISKRKWEAKNRATYQALKADLKCNRCPETDSRCLDFHHKDPTNKINNVANLVRHSSFETLKREIDKCEVLCANCHRKETSPHKH